MNRTQLQALMLHLLAVQQQKQLPAELLKNNQELIDELQVHITGNINAKALQTAFANAMVRKLTC